MLLIASLPITSLGFHPTVSWSSALPALALACVGRGRRGWIDRITSYHRYHSLSLSLPITAPIEPALLLWAHPASANEEADVILPRPHRDVNVSWAMFWCRAERCWGGTHLLPDPMGAAGANRTFPSERPDRLTVQSCEEALEIWEQRGRGGCLPDTFICGLL